MARRAPPTAPDHSEPITLVGVPRACRGVVSNDANNVALRTGLVSLAALDRDASISIKSPARIGRLKMRGRMRADQAAERPVKLRLPDGTPPGWYEVVVDGADGAARRVRVLVLEQRQLRYLPSSLRLYVRPGDSVTLLVNVLNAGNTTLTIPAHAAVALHAAERGAATALVHAAARRQGQGGFDALADEWARSLARDEPPPGRVRVREGAGELAAQASRLLTLELVVPARIRSKRSYVALLKLGEGALHLTLRVETPEREGEGR